MLGAVRLDGASGPVAGRVFRRRPLALLAVLAVSGEDGCSRDQLAGLLWGDSDDQHALHQLSDTLYVIRRELGPDAVVGNGVRVKLNTAVVASDVGAFHAALARGDRAGAVAAYGGALLEGFHPRVAAAFEEWLGGERARLSALYASQLESLAREAEAAGDRAAAAAWWQRLAVHDPYNSRAAVSLALALAATGDRANGLQHLRDHIRLLRDEMGMEADADVLAAEQSLRAPKPLPRVPSGPQVMGAEATGGPAAQGDRGSPAEAPEGHPTPGAPVRARWRSLVGPAGLVAVAAAIGIVFLARPAHEPARPGPGALDTNVVAVLPFRLVSTDSGRMLRHLALGVPALFEIKITGEFGPRIAYSPTVLRLWREAGGTLDAPLDDASELRLAQTVGAGSLIRGTLVATDTGCVLTGEVVAVPSGAVRVHRTEVTGRREDMLSLVDQLAWRLLAQEQGIPASRLPRLARYKPEAIQAYLAGNLGGKAGDLAYPRSLYKAALAIDSTMVIAALEAYADGERDEDTAYARFAWDRQDELTPGQRAHLLALVGWRFGATRTMAQRIDQYRALERLVPGGGRELSLLLTFAGKEAGVRGWDAEARQVLEPEMRRAPNSAWTWWPSLELAFYDRDTALIRQRLERFAATARGGRLGQVVAPYRWRFAMLRGDSAEAERVLAAAPDSGAVPYFAAAEGRGLRAADHVVAALGARFWNVDGGIYPRWRGRYEDWRRMDREFGIAQPPVVQAARRVRDALFLDGPRDSTTAAEAALLERVAEGRGRPAATPAQRAHARCWSTLWRLDHGDTTSARRAVHYLEREVEHPYSYEACVGLIDLFLTRARGGDVRASLRGLDSLVNGGPLPLSGPYPLPPMNEVANLTLARLLPRYGDTIGALAAARRRPIRWGDVGYASAYAAIPEFLREEGRLAALTGDRPGAIRAYTLYVALREDPDYAPWRAARDSVRRELAVLAPRPH